MSSKKTQEDRNATAGPADSTDYEALATWAETAEISADARITRSSGPGAGMELLAAAMGSPAAVRRAVGKPSMSEKGASPSRSVRLPADMDAELVALAKRAHVKPSEVIRRALGEYLSKAS